MGLVPKDPPPWTVRGLTFESIGNFSFFCFVIGCSKQCDYRLKIAQLLNVIVQVFARFNKVSGRVWSSFWRNRGSSASVSPNRTHQFPTLGKPHSFKRFDGNFVTNGCVASFSPLLIFYKTMQWKLYFCS